MLQIDLAIENEFAAIAFRSAERAPVSVSLPFIGASSPSRRQQLDRSRLVTTARSGSSGRGLGRRSPLCSDLPRSKLITVVFPNDRGAGVPRPLSAQGRRIYTAVFVGLFALGCLFLIWMTLVLMIRNE